MTNSTLEGCACLHTWLTLHVLQAQQDPGILAPAQAAADAISAPIPGSLFASAATTPAGSWHSPGAAGPHAQAVFSLADAAAAAATAPARTNDWLSPISDGLEWVLTTIKQGLDRGRVPFSYGWAIVGLTLCTKTLTYPLTKIQVRAPAVKSLGPSQGTGWGVTGGVMGWWGLDCSCMDSTAVWCVACFRRSVKL